MYTLGAQKNTVPGFSSQVPLGSFEPSAIDKLNKQGFISHQFYPKDAWDYFMLSTLIHRPIKIEKPANPRAWATLKPGSNLFKCGNSIWFNQVRAGGTIEVPGTYPIRKEFVSDDRLKGSKIVATCYMKPPARLRETNVTCKACVMLSTPNAKFILVDLVSHVFTQRQRHSKHSKHCCRIVPAYVCGTSETSAPVDYFEFANAPDIYHDPLPVPVIIKATT